MHLSCAFEFDHDSDERPLLEAIPAKAAVFALFPAADGTEPRHPYLGRTVDLRRRLGRLLAKPTSGSKFLNLRQFTRRIEYRLVGSPFEALWLLYQLNRAYFPRDYRQRLRLKPPALLKVNLRNRFPRCYPTRRISNDGSLYYGPFPSRPAAERFAAEFLDLFKIRRCVEDLVPDPAHPGCIYSQMRMCLAPCFAGCSDEEYRQEVARVVGFLDAEGRPLIRTLQAEREQASQALEFEQAARIHRRLERIQEVLRRKPELARGLRELHAVLVMPSAEPKSVTFFRVLGGELRGPDTLSLDENVPSPLSLDQQLHALLDALAEDSSRDPTAADGAHTVPRAPARLPSWEHLSLLARWYYSSFREGEVLMLGPDQSIPHARLIRLCRKVLAI